MFIGKDFNCTIRKKTDFINENEKDLSYLPQGYELDFRNNEDISVNEYDLQLVDLNIATIVGFLCCSTVELV